MNNRAIPPSARAAAKENSPQTETEAAQAKLEALRSSWRRVGETEDGKAIIRWLRNECGGDQSILGAIHGQIDEKATMYQAMRLNLWIKVRRMLTFNILKEIEYEPDQIS